jgi:hypothetical protein
MHGWRVDGGKNSAKQAARHRVPRLEHGVPRILGGTERCGFLHVAAAARGPAQCHARALERARARSGHFAPHAVDVIAHRLGTHGRRLLGYRISGRN